MYVAKCKLPLCLLRIRSIKYTLHSFNSIVLLSLKAPQCSLIYSRPKLAYIVR